MLQQHYYWLTDTVVYPWTVINLNSSLIITALWTNDRLGTALDVINKKEKSAWLFKLAVDLSHSGTLGSVERGQVEQKTLMMAPGHVKDPGRPASAMMVYC